MQRGTFSHEDDYHAQQWRNPTRRYLHTGNGDSCEYFICKQGPASARRTNNTDPHTLRVNTNSPRIYSIGDCSAAAVPAIHNVLAAVPVLAANIKKDLILASGLGEVGDDRIFNEDKRETQLVPIGRSMGVGVIMGWAIPGWLVWLIKGRDYWLWTTGRLWNGTQWNKEA